VPPLEQPKSPVVPGGVFTTTLKLPGAGIMEDIVVTLSWEPLATVVASVAPLKTTTEEETKWLPLAMMTKLGGSCEKTMVVGEIELRIDKWRALPQRGFRVLHPSSSKSTTSNDCFVNADGLCGDSLMVKRRSLAAQEPVLPGEAVMLGALAKRRSTPRIPVRRTAWITFNSSLKHEHIAMVKDISVKGRLFLLRLRPAVGDPLDFVVEFLTGSDKERLHPKGTVYVSSRVHQAPLPELLFRSMRNVMRSSP
jgi:hypothetical protein